VVSIAGLSGLARLDLGEFRARPSSAVAELPELHCPDAAAWRDWLAAHHDQAAGVWLKIAKAGSGQTSVTYAEAIDEALCFGWIDGQKRALDDKHWLQRFTPRRPRSKWSRINTEKAEALIAAGRMQAPGQAEVDAAKADGRWAAAYASPRQAGVPDDLAAALDANPAARAAFDALDSRNRYAVLYRVQDAKRPQTRAARIDKFVAMLADGGRLHP
jgi:uncharacterized protein YdeI (YjbR/CyaY-like superfamily)